MNYNVGDIVKIKSLDWYSVNKDEEGFVKCGDYYFHKGMVEFLDKIVTIEAKVCEMYGMRGYIIKEDNADNRGDKHFKFTDEMIECLVEKSPKMVRLDRCTKWLDSVDVKMYIVKDHTGTNLNSFAKDKFIEDFIKAMEE